MVYAAESGGGGGLIVTLLPLILLFAVMYFLMIRPQQRRRREAQELQSRLSPGDEVVTIGGLYGTIVDADDETVSLEISPGVTARYARPAIARVVSHGHSDEEELDEEEYAEEEADEVAEEVAEVTEPTAAERGEAKRRAGRE